MNPPESVDFERRIERRGAVIQANLSPRQLTHVIWAAGNMALETPANSPERPYIGEYLERIADRAAEQQVAWERDHPGSLAEPTLNFGAIALATGFDMLIAYGDPQLVGVDSSLRPVDYEAAVDAQEAVLTTWQFMGQELLGK